VVDPTVCQIHEKYRDLETPELVKKSKKSEETQTHAHTVLFCVGVELGKAW
jgi:hypothetical protein